MPEYCVGIYSPTLDSTVEHVVVNGEHPRGRYTDNEELAKKWAQEAADIANVHPDSGATDWEPRYWPRTQSSYDQWI